MAWYIMVGEQTYGPYEAGDLQPMIDAGQLTGQHYVWQDGMAEWQQAGSTLDLAPLFPTSQGAVMRRAIGQDHGPCRQIGFQSKFSGATWNGPVLASTKALYIVKGHKGTHGNEKAMTAPEKLVMEALINAVSNSKEDLRTCRVSDFPDAIKNTMDEPREYTRCDAIVIPKAAVTEVRIGAINNIMAFFVGTERFGVVTQLFGKGKYKKFLTDRGWPVNRKVAAAAPAIHGEGFQR